MIIAGFRNFVHEMVLHHMQIQCALSPWNNQGPEPQWAITPIYCICIKVLAKYQKWFTQLNCEKGARELIKVTELVKV